MKLNKTEKYLLEQVESGKYETQNKRELNAAKSLIRKGLAKKTFGSITSLWFIIEK